MPQAVTDPEILAQLNATLEGQEPQSNVVTDPELLAQLNATLGSDQQPQVKEGADDIGEEKDDGIFDKIMSGVKWGWDKHSAMREGFGQGLSFGFADEIDGAIMATGEQIKDLFTEGDIPWEESYERQRDKAREKYRQVEEEHPIASGVGEVMGIAAPTAAMTVAPVPGSRAAAAATGSRAVPILAKIAGSGAQGAAYGAGTSEADFGTDEFKDDVAMGGTVGVVAGGLGQGLARTPQAISKGVNFAADKIGKTVKTNKFLTEATQKIIGKDTPMVERIVYSIAADSLGAGGTASTAAASRVAANIIEKNAQGFAKYAPMGAEAIRSFALQVMGNNTNDAPQNQIDPEVLQMLEKIAPNR